MKMILKNITLYKTLKSIILLATVLFLYEARAQQLPQHTQFMFNQYVFNPAYAGVTDNWESVINNRYQWVGITDAPRTFTLSAQGPFKNEKMGIGGYVYTDMVGPTRRIGFQTSYAYHLRLTETIQLSLGLSFGFNQWLLDADKITTVHADDPFFSNGLIKTFNPDAKFGLYLYHKDWYFGAATPHLLHNKLKFKDASLLTNSYMEDHFYFNAGYIFRFGDDWELEPTALLKYSFPAPPKFDIALKTMYKKSVWLGVGFRTNDAMFAMVGYNHKNTLSLGYSFDITTTNLRNYSSGTHELLLIIKFGQTKMSGVSSAPSME